MKTIIKKVSLKDPAVINLINRLNEYQIGLYGIKVCHLESPESLEKNNTYMLGVYSKDELCAIGGVKILSEYAELKRMYILEKYRGNDIATKLISKLEEHAITQQRNEIVLETGIKHYAALKFYKKQGYSITKPYGSIDDVGINVFMRKKL